jgi:phosphoglycerate kinase
MPKRSIEQVDVASQRVLMRVDFNVPLDEGGSITDDTRIRLALPTLRSVIDRGGRLILMSHLGRPKGQGYEAGFSLRPAADRLGELMEGVPISFPGQDCLDEDSGQAIESMGDGEIVVLENLRFHSGEKKGDPEFAKALASYGDLYCNEAFGTAHRNHASMHGVPLAMDGKPKVAGLLLEKELKFLSETIANPTRPFIAILGGAKVSSKLGALHNLIGKVEAILIGGAMSYTLLKAKGIDVGSSLVERDMLEEASGILDQARASSTELVLPLDHVCGKEISSQSPTLVTPEVEIPEGWSGLDIGPKTADRYVSQVEVAKTIVWNGPMGVFETPPFDEGTRQVAQAMVQATRVGAISIVGGGDSASAVEQMNLGEHFSHISTGGGASLQMLEGRSFDSVELLD